MKQPDFYDTIYTYRPKIFSEKVNIVDNKLNIKYAENEKQYLQKFTKKMKKKNIITILFMVSYQHCLKQRKS